MDFKTSKHVNMDLSDFTDYLEGCKSNYLLNHEGTLTLPTRLYCKNSRLPAARQRLRRRRRVCRPNISRSNIQERNGRVRGKSCLCSSSTSPSSLFLSSKSRTKISGKEMDR